MSDNKNLYIPKSQKFSAEVGIGLPISRSSKTQNGATFLPYGAYTKNSNNDNLYPQYLAQMVFESPTHGAAIQRKSMMIKGRGFDLESLDGRVKSILEEMNDNYETANDLLEYISKDYAIFGGFALKVYWNGKGKVVQVEHVEFTDVRVGKPNEYGEIEYYVISNNWDMSLTKSLVRTETVPKFNPDVFEGGVDMIDGLPNPSDEQKMNACQLIYYYDKKPVKSSGMRYYPIPDYIGCTDSILTEIQIHISNKSLLDNGFGGKYIVKFPYFAQSSQEREENDWHLKESFSGASNNGGVITLYTPDDKSVPEVDKLDALDANTYLELNKETKQSIVTGHLIPAILLEYNYGGGFNNRSEEMTVAFDLYQKTNIKSYQDKIIRVFKKLLRYMGYENIPLTIIPFSLVEDSNTQGETSLTK